MNALTDPRNRDPLAITVGIISLMSNLGVWIWWGGHIDAREDSTERRVSQIEAQQSALSQVASVQAQNIAVLTVKLDDIKEAIDKTNDKLYGARR